MEWRGEEWREVKVDLCFFERARLVIIAEEPSADQALGIFRHFLHLLTQTMYEQLPFSAQ